MNDVTFPDSPKGDKPGFQGYIDLPKSKWNQISELIENKISATEIDKELQGLVVTKKKPSWIYGLPDDQGAPCIWWKGFILVQGRLQK